MKVNSIIGGTQKGGTTALFNFLSRHPQVSVPKDGLKELHFFDSEMPYCDWREPRYRAYEEAFPPSSEAKILLEATPVYLFWEPCAERIATYNPQMRLIFVLRDPVARAYSQWEMEFSRGTEIESFERAIELELQFNANNPNVQHRVRSYIARGFYWAQVRRFQKYFDRQQILLLRSDELLSDHTRTLDVVCEFLGLDRFSTYPTPRKVLPTNKDPTLPKLSGSLAGELLANFKDDLTQLHKSCGIYVKDWIG